MILISEIERLIFEVAWPRLVPCFRALATHLMDMMMFGPESRSMQLYICTVFSFVYWVANVFVSSL